MREHLQKVINGFYFVITMMGFILSYIGITKQDTLEWWIVISIVIFNSILLISVGIIQMILYFKYKNNLNQLRCDRDNIEKIQKNCKAKCKDLIIYYKYINGTLNKFLPRLYAFNDEYFAEIDDIREYVELMKNSKVDEEKIENKKNKMIANTKQKHYDRIIDEYRRVLSNITTHLKNEIESYLSCEEKAYNVAITIKLLNKPLRQREDYFDTIVFTAFRDSMTYMEGKREIGEKKYSIYLNSDFLQCLEKEMYVCNCVNKNSENYMNENSDFTKHYNSSVTVPILCQEGSKKIFGYLACDTLVYNNDKVFDREIANILYSTALLLGTYFDNISYAMEYILQDYDDFLDFIYKKSFKVN